ncbi:MBG domain-containing protein [Sinomicrobium oceani]|uniref:MBG domain-containing protein n=1 Tax=Sinomicrobium oceani TaxID=1150368 RepID=UPI00227B9642|nr:MBG domain-containing protein [Sinomicrobium oceani]
MKIPLRFLKQSSPFAIAQNIVVLMILLFTGLPGSGVFAQSCAGSQVHFYNPVLGVDQTYTVPYDPGREVVLESFTPVGGSLGESPGILTTNVSYESSDPTVAVIREENSRFYLVIQGAGTSTIAVHYDDDPAGCKTVFTLEVLPPVIQPGVGNILYVNRGVSGGNGSGDRWTNAIPELRDALAWAADNWDADINGTLQVWVAKGKYLPTDNPADRGAYFPLLGSVEIYGGFNATETGLEDRDRQQNVTILSGDIDDNDTGVDGIITDPQTQIHGNNSHHVVIALDRDTGAVLDGVTITAGMADGTQFATAGNAGDSEGGGMFIAGSSLTLTHITFRGNYASLGGGGLVVYSSDIEVAGSQLINNQSDNDGGGINAAHSTLTLINSTLTKNKGKSGGAISSSGGILMLINSTLSRNRAGADGGGINNMENTAVTLVNSILSGNRAEGEGNEMYNSSTIDGVVSVSHSLYNNGTNDMVTADFGSGVTFETTAVIHDDPQFADPDNDDYSLLATSPAINAGSNTLWENTTGSLTGSETDLAGNARVYAYANGGMIDIGAYEFQGNPEPPVVTDVVTPADSTYSAGENLDFTVNFDKNVDVNTSGGAPRLSIIIGASTQYANYLSGSGTSSLVYRYTVQSGDQDNDGITVGALETNGGTIQNGNVDADLTLQNVGSTSDIRIDAVVPSGYSVSIDQAQINISNTSAVSFTFAGAEAGATYNYTFTSSGGGTPVTGSGTIITATDRVTGINLSGLGDGTATLSAVLTDAAGNTGASVTDTRIKKVNTAPTVTGVSVAGILTVGEQLTGHYTFTDPDGDTEAGSAYRWYRSDDDTGTGKTVISGALSSLYTLQGGDRGKYISFEVTPGDGDMSGFAVKSSPVGPVKADQSITFPAISAKTYGDTTFTLGDAYTDQGLLVTYTAADPTVVNINGNQATILRAGSTTITAVQPGDSQTNPAVAVEQTLTVNKAPLRITADDQSKVYGATDPALTVSYNGFVHNDEETLLEGTLSVSRAPGEDAGTYAITATGYTSDNYAISYTGGIFEITRAAITVTADGQTKVYGTADPELTYTVSPALAGNDTFTGMPVRETGEAVGEYTIAQGALTAGSNYNITFEEAILTITPANLEHITFDDGGFTYDGSVHRLSVTGRLPADVSVTYLNNGRTDAGTQTVTARIDGGENYRDTELTATLTVYRATQHIVFRPIPSRNLESTSGFVLDAYTASGLPVTYSYTYEGSGPAATVSPDGAVTLLSSGEITITANQEGNPNFLPAPPVSRTLRISSSDAAIRTLRIAGMVYENPGPETRYVVDCDRMAGSVEVAIETEANAIVNPAHQFTVDLPRPGLYTETITVISEDGNTTRTYKVVLEKRFASDDIIIQKFNNVLLVNNNPQTNGGYDFVTYAWYKNGNYTGNGQYYSAGDNSTDLLDPDATYHVEMTTTDGQVLRSCPMKPQIQHSGKIIVYPNPVLTGNTVNIQADIPEAKRENMKVQLYNHTGREIKHFVTDRKNNTVQVSGMLPGVYIIRCTTDDLQKSFKIIVK